MKIKKATNKQRLDAYEQAYRPMQETKNNMKLKQMQNCNLSARTADKQSSKSPLLFRQPCILVMLLLCAVFLGCQEKGKSINSVQQGDFKVEFLFEKNGCKMYRFLDGYRYIYWSDCQGKTQSDYTTQSGKTTVTHHEETVTSK